MEDGGRALTLALPYSASLALLGSLPSKVHCFHKRRVQHPLFLPQDPGSTPTHLGLESVSAQPVGARVVGMKEGQAQMLFPWPDGAGFPAWAAASLTVMLALP